MFKSNIDDHVSSAEEHHHQEERRFIKAILISLAVSFFSLISIGNSSLWAADSENALSADTLLSSDDENVLSDETALSTDSESILSDDIVLSSGIGEVSGDLFVIPKIYDVSINMLNISDAKKKEELLASIKTLLIGGREKEAAVKLGEFFGLERKNSKEYLGLYCRNALPSVEGDLNDRARFLSWFLVGYRKNGVLMVSHEGIEKISASGKRRGEFWRNVEDIKIPPNKLDRIYKASDATYIPFSAGEIFILDIVSSNQGKATVWKILPGDMNKKTWLSGEWEREITVRGDKLY
jgi:hypothetical protein